MAGVNLRRGTRDPYRMSVMPDDVPSMDVSDPHRVSVMPDDYSSINASNPYRVSAMPDDVPYMDVSDPYRVSVMPDDVPSMDVSEQTWSDSATNVPEEASEGLTPTTKADLLGSSGPPPHHLSKHVLRKIKRLAKKRSKEIEILTVFTKDGDIVCSHEAPNASAEQPGNYFPNPAEGRYLRLAIELGFKQEGCPFEFGNVNWLSGTQEEVDDKLTLLGLPDGEHPGDGPHKFYGVLSPTGRYVFVAVLREGPSGALEPKSMRKLRDLADKLEVYEQWAGKGGLISRIAARF